LSETATDVFTASRRCFTELLAFTAGAPAAALDHAALEEQLSSCGRELLRRLYQDHLDLRADREVRLAAIAERRRGRAPPGRGGPGRTLATVFGEVTLRLPDGGVVALVQAHPGGSGATWPKGDGSPDGSGSPVAGPCWSSPI